MLFFARSRELAGCHEAAVEVRSSCTARDVFDRIVNFYPGYMFAGLQPPWHLCLLQASGSFPLNTRRIEALRGEAILAIREEYRDFSDHLVLVAGDEVAIIPPISGG